MNLYAAPFEHISAETVLLGESAPTWCDNELCTLHDEVVRSKQTILFISWRLRFLSQNFKSKWSCFAQVETIINGYNGFCPERSWSVKRHWSLCFFTSPVHLHLSSGLLIARRGRTRIWNLLCYWSLCFFTSPLSTWKTPKSSNRNSEMMAESSRKRSSFRSVTFTLRD
jgi:hypothetical protein